MKIALLRVGIDTGCGGMHGPLFRDGGFEYVPIPSSTGKHTYGNTRGRRSKPLASYFPLSRQNKVKMQRIHFDPEFKTFTYGDPTSPKAGLRRLERGDHLIFYSGLKGHGFKRSPALYVIGYFIVKAAGYASSFSDKQIRRQFRTNHHIIAKDSRAALVLVKGGKGSRLFERAVCISAGPSLRATEGFEEEGG